MRDQKNWEKKTLKIPITIKPLSKKILPKMLFRIPKGEFSHKKCSFSHNNNNNELLIIMIISSK